MKQVTFDGRIFASWSPDEVLAAARDGFDEEVFGLVQEAIETGNEVVLARCDSAGEAQQQARGFRQFGLDVAIRDQPGAMAQGPPQTGDGGVVDAASPSAGSASTGAHVSPQPDHASRGAAASAARRVVRIATGVIMVSGGIAVGAWYTGFNPSGLALDFTDDESAGDQPAQTPEPSPNASVEQASDTAGDETDDPAAKEASTGGAQGGATPDQVPQGSIGGEPFQADHSRIRAGNLRIREGKDFIPDKEIELSLTGDDDPAKRDWASSRVESASVDLRDTQGDGSRSAFLHKDYEVTIRFGEANHLGVPYRLRFSSSGDMPVEIEGRDFATFGNFRTIDGEKLDRSYDSLPTLERLARRHVEKADQWGKIKEGLHTESTSYEPDYPKSGLVVLEVEGQDGESRHLRVQMRKDASGWAVFRVLEAGQIHPAHPVQLDLEGDRDSEARYEAERVAGQRLESWLNRNGFMDRLDSTSVGCELDDSLQRASCRALYRLEEEGGLKCAVKTWLLSAAETEWSFEREIDGNKRVAPETGELETYEPRRQTCRSGAQ